jgi:hypothetical protein
MFYFENSKFFLNSTARVLYRTYQSNTGLYLSFQTDTNAKQLKNATHFLIGLKSLWLGLRF